MAKTWREYYQPQIAAIIKENEGKSVKEIRRVLYKANPGQYTHMKRIWSDESLKQLGLKKRTSSKQVINLKQLKIF